ncbi:MAG: TIGR01458 family HAD-type hydrolase [Methanospirillum sp.]
MNVDAVLIDLDGVLYVGDAPIPGALEAVEWLRNEKIPFRCVTNTTRRSRRAVAARLRDLGFAIPEAWCFTPALAAVRRLGEEGVAACHLIATGDVHRDFEDAGILLVAEEAPYVVVADAGDAWTYGSMNRAFRLLVDGARLLALERDRYWRDADGLALSAGPFVAALEYAAGMTAEVVGKPSSAFFRLALADLGVPAERAVMVGDDIATDVGGARAAGLRAVLVRTGKFRPEALAAAPVAPDRVLGSIADLPALLEHGA